jgi:hypothetical protein
LTKKVMLLTLITNDIQYTLAMMYRIGRDNKGTILVCLSCTHSERVQDSNQNLGNPRTLAAQAMLNHVRSEHSRETHVRAMAMVMERQHAPR